MVSCGHGSPVEPGQPSHVGKVGQRDPGLGASEADGADDQPETLLLFGKDVLGRSVDAGPPRVPAGKVLRHRLPLGFAR